MFCKTFREKVDFEHFKMELRRFVSGLQKVFQTGVESIYIKSKFGAPWDMFAGIIEGEGYYG